ncbi:DctP family TRAP transporter solute-binding subunit [candidate division KSB1 bacterium]|nr:DctP family TRAP transporter solute-binding subunit [candidate division KSB1 bacterium]
MKNLLFCILLPLFLIGCGSESDTVNLKMGHGLDTSHPVHKAMLFMADKAAEKSNGKMTIDVYPSEQLGNEKEMLEQLQMGSVAMTKVSSSVLESFVDEMRVFALPYLFRDDEHKWQVFNGPIGQQLLDTGKSKGLKGLVYYDAGARSFYTVDKPIQHPDDLKGLKIRTQQSPMAMKLIQTLGGSATPISWGELYTSLQQGVVDGAENNPPSLYTARHYEVCKHYSLDKHTMVPDVVVISTVVWKKLKPELQQILIQSAKASVPYQIELWNAFVDECMRKMKEQGLQVYQPDKALFKQRALALWQEFEGTKIGELAQQIQEVNP